MKANIYSIRKQNLLFVLQIIAPAFLLAFIILYYPIINSIMISIQNRHLGKVEYKWAGLENFIEVFSSGKFLYSFWWTIVFGVLSSILLFIVGMYFALLLNRKMKGTNVIRGILLMPWAIPVFVNAFLWLWLLNVQFGLINYILVTLKVLKEPIHWTGGSFIAKVSVIMAFVWRAFPFNMIVYLAAFQTIDPVYYEASEIDGAGKFKQFIYITLPSIRNIIIFTMLLNFIWSFQEFTTIWILTRGGPAEATNTLITRVFMISFLQRDFGIAAANGVIWIIFLIAFSLIYLRLLFFRKDETI